MTVKTTNGYLFKKALTLQKQESLNKVIDFMRLVFFLQKLAGPLPTVAKD